MNNIIPAGQTYAYDLYKKKIKLPKEKIKVKHLENIVRSKYPNCKDKFIEQLFLSMYKSGCTYASVTNAIIEQLKFDKTDEEFLYEFEEMFGFSLYDKENDCIDYNRLLVDLYTRLYNVSKIRTCQYKTYTFDSIKEAAISLVKECNDCDESDASLILYNAGIWPDGFDENKKYRFKDVQNPIITDFVGTYQEFANKFLNGTYDFLTNDEITALFKENNISISSKDLKPESKFSGLTTSSINFWVNEYFKMKNINLEFNADLIYLSKYTIEEFFEKMENIMSKHASISVGIARNTEVWMRDINKKRFSWTKIEGEKSGHAMFFEGFDENGDIIVSSWGKSYVIPIEYYNKLELTIIQVKQKENEISDEENLGVMLK